MKSQSPGHRGSLRTRYRYLPKTSWAELNRLKREELFSDLPGDPGPGGLALMRFVLHPDTGYTILEAIIVTAKGEVLRFAELMRPPTPLPRVA